MERRRRRTVSCAIAVVTAALTIAFTASASAYNPIVPTQAGSTVTLDGKHLTVDQVVAVARYGAQVQLTPQARQRSLDAYNLMIEGARQDIPIYWFNRAPGSGRETVIFSGDPNSAENKKLLLDRQLATFKRGARSGIGPEVSDEEITRAMMVVRANTMVYEAATPQLTQMLLDLLNKRITPVVQSRGTPGEGDLPQMSNVGATMVGSGQAYLNGVRMPAGQALAMAGLQPLVPFAADDAALTSSNAYTVGQTALLLNESKRMLDWSDMTYSMSMLGLNSSVTPLTAIPQNARPYPYQNWLSRRLLDTVRGSYLFDLEPDVKRIIQDPLSFRDYNQRQGAVWQAYKQLEKDTLIQINSSDHNPAIVPGTKPSDSWELNTPWLRQYYVNQNGKRGYIVSNSNFNVTTLNNDTQAFVMALAESMAGTTQRVLRFEDTFFTVITPSDVLPADVTSQAPSRGASYTISDLMAEIQSLANPVPAQGNALVRQVEDMEAFGRIKVARARLAVDTASKLVAQEMLSASYWMEVRKAQKPTRSFGDGPTAALAAFRAVVPWQSTSRPDVPDGEMAYSFMQGVAASTFLAGGEVKGSAASVRSRASKARKSARSKRAGMRTRAHEAPRVAGKKRR